MSSLAKNVVTHGLKLKVLKVQESTHKPWKKKEESTDDNQGFNIRVSQEQKYAAGECIPLARCTISSLLPVNHLQPRPWNQLSGPSRPQLTHHLASGSKTN